MIIKPNQMTKVVKDNMRGGEGSVTLTLMQQADQMEHCRLMARVDIPVGAGIGEHDHCEETEYYIIQSGKGMVCDDGTDREVNSGDLVVTGGGSSHNIRNIGDEPLVLYAIIVTDER